MKNRSGTGRDAAWAHGTKLDNQDETEAKIGQKVRCNYCFKVVNGITRLKQHLAKVGGGVKSCPSVPESVYREFLKCFEEYPYRSIVKPKKNHDIEESSHAGGQSSTHEQTSTDAQTEDGGSHHNAVMNEAEIAQKNLYMVEKAFQEFKDKAKAEKEQYRKIQETTSQQLKEKVQEVEEKNCELNILRAALKAKKRELAVKEDEMDRLRAGAIAAEANRYMQGRDEIIIKAKEVGFNHKLLLPSAYDPTENAK